MIDAGYESLVLDCSEDQTMPPPAPPSPPSHPPPSPPPLPPCVCVAEGQCPVGVVDTSTCEDYCKHIGGTTGDKIGEVCRCRVIHDNNQCLTDDPKFHRQYTFSDGVTLCWYNTCIFTNGPAQQPAQSDECFAVFDTCMPGNFYPISPSPPSPPPTS